MVLEDFLGPLPSGELILVVIDYYSGYYVYAIMKDYYIGKDCSSFDGNLRKTLYQ